MANFLLVIDPVAARRTRFLAEVGGELAFLPGLARGGCDFPTFGVRWAIAPQAPLSRELRADRSFSLVIGAPQHADSGRALDAADFGREAAENFARAAAANGFYAALHHRPDSGWRVEADVLGLFPIYYWACGEVLLVGSSPLLFRRHPLFSGGVDLQGAAALLLTSGIVGGRTLLPGVRRLGRDHVLFFDPLSGVREQPPPQRAPAAAPDTLDDAVEEVASLHRRLLAGALAGSRQPGLLLSGGLDSRLLAGLLHTLGHRPQCLTFGGRRDMDAICAGRVAATLRWPQVRHEVDFNHYAAYAERSVDWEQLSGGLYALPMGWNLTSAPGEAAPDRIVCGLTLDAVIGGAKHVVSTGGRPDFEQLRTGTLGFARAELEQLVRSRALLEACEEVRAEVAQSYRDGADDDHGRAWAANLSYRQRFPVGACAWRYSFHAWPVLPALDRRLIALAAALPPGLTAGRRIQRALLVRDFPALAALDLDRNYYDTRPLLGAPASRLRDLRHRAVKFGRRVRSWIGADARFYVRVMDLNSPGWRSVRRASEGARGQLAELFDLPSFARILPAPHVVARRGSDPIVHSTPLKNSIGLMLWLARYS